MDAVGLTIRPGREADFPAIALQYGPGDSPWDPFGSPDRMQQIPIGGLLVAELRGAYAGFLYWFESRRPWFAPAEERCAFLQELHVRPELQGRRIGRRLVERFVQEVRAQGMARVYVETGEENRRARALYESVGFRPYRTDVHLQMSLEGAEPSRMDAPR